MRYQKKWINRFMIYQKNFVDILLLFNGMILNYLYFHFYDSRYILRLSKFQKMLTVCLLALMFVLFILILDTAVISLQVCLAFYLFVFSIILKKKANILLKSYFSLYLCFLIYLHQYSPILLFAFLTCKEILY